MSELKPESILTYLGFEADKVKTEEEFKTQFEGKFGVKDLLLKDPAFVGKIYGQKLGSIEAKVKANAKKMGVEFAKEEIEGKGVEDILELSFTKIAEMNKTAMDAMEKSSKGSVDEQVKTWKDKYQSEETKRKEWEGMAGKTATEFEAFKKDAVTAQKTRTINNFKQDAIKKLEFKQDITPVERMGFESVLNDKYIVDVDDTDTPFWADKKTGQRIPSKKVTGTFMTGEEILNEELIANKLAKINPQGGKKVTNPYAQTQDKGAAPAGTTEGKKQVYINPRATMAAGL